MNRRNFLLQSGIIAPAVLLMPDVVVAEFQQDDADLAMLQAGSGRVRGLAERFRSSGKSLKEVNVVQVGAISWNGNLFRISTKSGYSFTVKKLVINSAYIVDRERGVVVIPSSPKAMEIAFDVQAGSKEPPQFWMLPGKQMGEHQIAGFMKKEAGGFMCIA